MTNPGFTQKAIFIPRKIENDERLNLGSRVLYGFILTTIASKPHAKEAIFDLRTLAEQSNVTTESISSWIAELIERGMIKKAADDVIEKMCRNKNLAGRGNGNNVCEWCRVNTASLHRHHHPVLRSKGGTATVSICPNCHSEFHNLRVLAVCDAEIIRFVRKAYKERYL